MRTIDWTAVITAAEAGKIDPAVEHQLEAALRANASRRNRAAIWEHVKQAVTEAGYDTAVAVVFDTTEWDNGYFLEPEHPTVYLPDGHTKRADLDAPGPGALNELFVDEYGTLSRYAGLLVDLRTPGEVNFDEDAQTLMGQIAGELPTPPPIDHNAELFRVVLEQVAAMARANRITGTPLAVVFGAVEYTDGCFYELKGALHTDQDGHTVPIELRAAYADEHLIALSKQNKPGRYDALLVDLRNGNVVRSDPYGATVRNYLARTAEASQ